jgi:hypothetical protein
MARPWSCGLYIGKGSASDGCSVRRPSTYKRCGLMGQKVHSHTSAQPIWNKFDRQSTLRDKQLSTLSPYLRGSWPFSRDSVNVKIRQFGM